MKIWQCFKLVCLVDVLLASIMALGEVKCGENVLLNGRFETDQTELPLYWTVNGPRDVVTCRPADGPGGAPCMAFRNPDGRKVEVALRQYGIQLVSNALYRASVKVRTRNFKSRNCGAVAINNGWYWAGGVRKIPSDAEWTLLTGEFRAKASSNGQYSMAVYAIDFSGELDVADFRLEALDEAALKGTVPSGSDESSKRLRLVPWNTRLREIPRASRQVAFCGFGKLPSNCMLTVEVGGKTVCAPLESVRTPVTLTLPEGLAASGTLTARLEAGGKALCAERFAYRLVDPVDTRGHRRLNNFATEVLNAKGDGEWTFTVTRDSWVFISAKAREVWLDGLPIIDAETPRGETFRQVAYGSHRLAVRGADAKASVVVRQIVEIFNYCPGANSFVTENRPYDWEFQRRHVLPAVTTQNGGNIPGQHRAWFRSQGYRWLANLGTTALKDDEDLVKRLKSARGMTQSEYDGLTCDEQFFGQPGMLDRYIVGLKTYANPAQKLIYTWIVGKPGTPGVDHEFLSVSREASGGRGKVLFEAYCRTRATEEEARDYLRDFVVDTVHRYRQWCPGIESSVGVAFGNFNQMPVITLVHHPEVDFKYYLDMQMQLAATDPTFRDLGLVGYWGSYYGDRELHRWSFALTRHYCVEGNTELLSKRHGFRYLPGHLQNGDFRGSLAGWSAVGDVKTDMHRGFGGKNLNRWGGSGGLGDTFAVLTRRGDAPNRLSQTIRRLVPGCKYCLQFASFDVDDVKAHRIAPRRFGIRATLGPAAEIDPSETWQHIDRRDKGRYAFNDGVARINLHHIVFTARASEISLAFDDALATPGEHLGLNSISLNPFYD